MRLARGGDIRALGSGTAGAHNVLRVAGRRAAIATFLFDAAKGGVAVFVARMWVDAEWAGALALLCVVVGHVLPAQLSFRGGKGLAPGFGAMLVVDPLAMLIAAAGGIVAGVVARRITVAALATVAFGAPAALLTGHSWGTVLAVAAASLLILIAHHRVIERLRPALLDVEPRQS